jgi:hypothetical protein
MKKEAIPERMGLLTKTSDEKRDNPKIQVDITKTFDEKRGNPRMHGARNNDL